VRHLLGISAYYHDSAAALIRDGTVVAAAQEERLTRRKNDERFPTHAVDYCLRAGGLQPAELDAVVFYDKPIVKFARLLETYLAFAPRGFKSFVSALPNWLAEKLNLRRTLREELPLLSPRCPLLFTRHHEAHAASAFFPSPFPRAAILTIDGVGEYATTLIGRGDGNRLELLKEIHFPHSLGLLYSAFTAYCGFRVNSGEYKLMGLAPYGEPTYARLIEEQIVHLLADGSFRLNLEFFDLLGAERLTNPAFHRLFDGPPRRPEDPILQRHMDIARSIQDVTERMVLRLAEHTRAVTGEDNLCLAGGVALNCVANGQLLRSGMFRNLWIQPAAGDAGGALGAALAAWHRHALEHGLPRQPSPQDAMQGALLGPAFSDSEIESVLAQHGAIAELLDQAELLDRVVDLLQQEKVIGWFQGRMEFGPRALGSRSILGDARSTSMQSTMNLKVKFRESFRPFAPIVLRERVADYFELDQESPYMLLVAPVRQHLRTAAAAAAHGLDQIRAARSSIPAVTHVDYSARIQTVTPERNGLLCELLRRFEKATGCAVLVNTSFNVRGEPIVCTPDDAYRCFMNTEMDYLVMGSFLISRTQQPTRSVQRRGELIAD